MTRIRRQPLFPVESGARGNVDPDIFPAAVSKRVILGLWSMLLLALALLTLLALTLGNR